MNLIFVNIYKLTHSFKCVCTQQTYFWLARVPCIGNALIFKTRLLRFISVHFFEFNLPPKFLQDTTFS